MNRSSFAALACAFFAAAPAVAKPLYITVPRAYGTSESAVVDVAFGGTDPVELRVTRPTRLDTFIAEQANLRRAYAAPPTQVNPGRHLARGLNAVKNPGPFVLFALDEDVRKELADVLPERGRPKSAAPLSRLVEGPPKLVGLPAGTALVRTEWLNLDLGGAERSFDVPGFDAWSGHSRFQDRRVVLSPLPAGVYVLQLVQGRIEAQVTLVVTDLTVQVKQTDGEVLARVADRSQRPVAGAQVTVFAPGEDDPSGTTDAKGEARLTMSEPRVLVVARRGEDVALVDTDFYTSLSASPDVFVYSDRPIYKPGDTVHFRGVVRKPSSFLARLFAPRERNVSVTLISRHGKASEGVRLRVDELGTFAGSLVVGEGEETGVVRVVATLDEHEHQSEARVQAYVKPTFYLELSTDQDSVVPGDTITARVRARRYAGGIPERATYQVFLYRSLLLAPAWVDDAGLGGQGSAVTYGSVATTEGKLSVPTRLYVSDEVDFDDKGEATITVPVPPLLPGEERTPFEYRVTVRATDQENTTASTSRAFFLADCDVMGQLASRPALVEKGGAATLSVRSVTLGGRAVSGVRGEAELVLREASGDERRLEARPFTTGADGTFRTAWPTTSLGTMVARVTLRDQKDRLWRGETKLLVVGAAGEQVARVPTLTAEALGSVLEPGAEGRLVALLPDGWGPGGQNRGPMWLTLSGAELYATELLDVSGSTLVHAFTAERRFGSAVYASLAYPTASGRWEERTVAYRIVPKERALTVRVTPERAEAQPLTRQTLRLSVTDHAGLPVRAQLSVGVVDKAIYALQGELRPGILDFFYPLGRNNVASFSSAEFQGYGYGEYLARALSRRAPFEFAAVKPPTRRIEQKDRDTAYWSPRVSTDAEGNATVTFELPSNQTSWVVTAVAADASGRFGEGRAEFASRGQVTLAAALPQFLRQGDVATGSVRLARPGEAAAGPLALTTTVAGALRKEELSLPVGGEKVLPLALEASAGEGALAVTLTLDGVDPGLRERREVPVRPASIEETLVIQSAGGGELMPKLPAGQTVESVELRLLPSTVAAALSSVHDLLSYPYGCLEQLVATTVPNIAIYRTLERTGALARLDADSRALLELAQSRATQGLDRILALATKSGGFTWFGGYDTPSLATTLIALDGLAYAAEAGLVRSADPRIESASTWLAAQEGLPAELDVTRAYVLARLGGARQAPRVRALLEARAGSDLYTTALLVLAAQATGVAKESASRARLAELVAASRAGVDTVHSYAFDRPAFFAYPLRRAGLTALLLHAASFGQIDEALARRTMIETLAAGEAVSTFERSTTLLHGLWLLERDAKALRVAEPPSVEVAGQKDKVRLAPIGVGFGATLASTVTRVDVGSFDGVASLRLRVRTPLTQVVPEERGMALGRRYFLLDDDGRRRELAADDVVPAGAHVFVELTIDAHQGAPGGALRSAYYVVEDAIPAGFVAVGEDKRFRGAPYELPLAHEALKSRSLNTESAHFFFEEPTFWSRSPRLFGYVLRAQHAGTFAAPPAEVKDMYAAQVGARTRAATLRIAAR